jgi:DNA-binding SARP family transcriptional activator/TolB-like protein
MNVAERIGQTASPARLVVRCLGRFRVENNAGDQLQIRTRKARAVLAALAFSGRPMGRDVLADLLWSDRGTVQARSSLRQAIFDLQHLAGRDAQFLVVGRDDLAIDQDQLVTDVSLIRKSAAEGDWARLLALLEASESGLLADLDGLDGEFDDWLRIERAQEPARTLATAVDAAERCLTEAGPRAAIDLVSQILRLDPVNEEATRLAFRIDHQLGDSRALHHHFNSLSGRLREDYGAEPSAETADLFRKLASAPAARVANLEGGAERGESSEPARWYRLVVPLLVLALAAGLLALLVWRDRLATPVPAGPTLIAVLPFEQQPAGDRFLAEGLWEDTREAVSRSGAVRVLGRATTKTVVEQNLPPSEYRRRFGVDYLLEGSVQRAGERVRVAVSLTRTSDGVSIWEHAFRGRLGDPFALQEAIAESIEGKIRGRVAAGGGRRADQIVTTPEVYALYSEARSLIRMRESVPARRADALLRQALAADPNYAPAWSALGAALYFEHFGPMGYPEATDEAMTAVLHALSLAPNLAEAHATLALLKGDNSPDAEAALRRAISLDSSNAEAWNWLGNALNSQARYSESIKAYQRAVDVDPFWFPPTHNLMSSAVELGDSSSARRLLNRLEATGASRELIDTTRAEQLIAEGDYSEAYRLIDALRDWSGGTKQIAVITLARLGYFEAAGQRINFPNWFAPVLRGRALPPTIVDGKAVTPRQFWADVYFPAYASRTLLNLGQAKRLVDIYRGAFRNSDDFLRRVSIGDPPFYTATNVAIALRSTGAASEADYILSASLKRAEANVANAPQAREPYARVAFIRGAQGNREAALKSLGIAASRGWLPDGIFQSLDLAEEPSFRTLRGDPRFEAIRKRILDHIAKERAELGPLKS